MPTIAPEGFKFTSIGRPRRYEWEDYTDGRVWMFQRGDDFPKNVSTASFRSSAYSFGKRYGFSVRTAVSSNTVFVQFIAKRKGK